MATRGKKISEQTLAASLDGNEVIPFAKNGANGAVKASKIKEYVQPDLTAKQDKLVNSADVTVGEDDKLTVTDLAKREVFDDLWIKAAGSFGTVDHTHTEDGVNKPYYLNEVWMTYEEAIVVYNEYYADIKSLYGRVVYGVTNFAPPVNSAAVVYSNFIAPNAVTINVGIGFLVDGFT